jgi:hypothetical protein
MGSVERFLQRLAPVWSPHPGQREFLEAGARITVLACGRRWGKTDACAAKALFALTQERPVKHLVIAPTLDQARLLFDRLARLIDEAGPMLGLGRPKLRRTPYPQMTIGPHRLQARSGHLGHALRGGEATHIVVDEAAYLPERVITEVAMPMLATTDGALALISTPNGRNHFWRFFEFGTRGEHGVWSRAAPSWESPLVSQGFLDVQRELIPERAFRVEYGAEFLDTAGAVFRSEAVEACLVPRVVPQGGPVRIGVDWARYGDYTAVAVLEGTREEARLVQTCRFHGLSWGEQARRVADVLTGWPEGRVVCDATGLGDPVLEMLRALCPRQAIEGAVFTSSVKGELIDGLAWLIERGALRFEPDVELLRELRHFHATPTEGGGLRLEAARGYHDDLVVALALAARELPRGTSVRIALGHRRAFRRGTAVDDG